MSIHAFTGLPGSGKSYGVVANEILPALKAGRVVVTNIPLNEALIRESITTGEIRSLPLDQIAAEPGLITDYATPGCVLVIDELWRLFPSGQKVDKVPQPFKSLLAEHRHMVDAEGRSMQIVFVTQDLAQIGMFARQLVEQTYHHTKLGHLGMSGSYKCGIYHGPVTGAMPSQQNLLRTVHGQYNKSIYQYYKSHTMSESATAGADEKPIDKRGNVWKRPGFIIGAVFAVVMIGVAIHVLGNFFGRKKAATPASASVATAGGRPVPAEPIGLYRAPAPAYRVAMIVQGSDAAHSFAVLDNDAGSQIWVPSSQCFRDGPGWRCRYQGQWLSFAGIWHPPKEDTRPILASSGAPAEPVLVGKPSPQG